MTDRELNKQLCGINIQMCLTIAREYNKNQRRLKQGATLRMTDVEIKLDDNGNITKVNYVYINKDSEGRNNA